MIGLIIDERKKKEIHDNEIHNSRISLFPKIVIVVWIVSTIAVLIVTLKASEETYKLIGWCTLAFIIIFGFTMLIVAQIAVKRITGKYLSERINESMVLNGSTLEYGYQNFADHTPLDRVVIKIPLENLSSVKIDRKRKKVELRGKICQMYYDNYLTGETRAKEEYTDRTVILFDYFEPSLIETLERETHLLEKAWERYMSVADTESTENERHRHAFLSCLIDLNKEAAMRFARNYDSVKDK